MRVWLVTVGEPVPVGEAVNDKLHRAGQWASYLAEHGHDVTWWTSTFDHFRKKHIFDQDTELRPSENLRIKLIRGTGYGSNVSPGRIRDQRVLAAKFAKQAAAESDRPDIIVASLPIIELCEECVNYGKKNDVPVILDMRDMWPDICIDTVPAPVRPLARILLSPMLAQSKRACAGATAITGITDAFVDWGLERGSRQKTELDRSFPFGKSRSPLDPEKIRTAEEFWDNLGIPDKPQEFVVCFFGAIGYHFDLESSVRAAQCLEAEGRNIRWVICGIGDKLEHYKSMAEGLSSVMFPGWMDAAQIRVLMQRASVGLDPMPCRYDYLASINNKALEYMSTGLPVISCPKQGVLYDLLRKHDCGLSYDQGDADGLAAVVRELSLDDARLKRLSANSAMLFESAFTVEKVFGDMMKYLEFVRASGKAGSAPPAAMRNAAVGKSGT